jgi:hypothetical protein
MNTVVCLRCKQERKDNDFSKKSDNSFYKLCNYCREKLKSYKNKTPVEAPIKTPIEEEAPIETSELPNNVETPIKPQSIQIAPNLGPKCLQANVELLAQPNLNNPNKSYLRPSQETNKNVGSVKQAFHSIPPHPGLQKPEKQKNNNINIDGGNIITYGLVFLSGFVIGLRFQ